MLYRGGGLETRGLGREPQAGSGAAAPGRVRGGSPAKKFFVFSFCIYLFLSVSVSSHQMFSQMYAISKLEPTDYQMGTYVKWEPTDY